jgi:hypothetical protein
MILPRRNRILSTMMIKFIWTGSGLLAVAAVIGLLMVAGRLSPPRPAHASPVIPAASLPTGCHC